MNRSNVVTSVHFLKEPDDIGSLPVLTDVLVPATQPGGTTLWLAWDERRVPVLNDAVEEPMPLSAYRFRAWRGK